MTDWDTLREHVEASKGRSEGIDPSVVLRLIDALQAVEPELLLLRDIVSDLDELMSSEEGPLLQPNHSCRVQRRVAQFMREQWKSNYQARGNALPSRTWGRGRG